MNTITTSHIPETQINELGKIAESIAAPELREFLRTISQYVSEGAELTAAGPSESLSPADAAKALGMSRTHLYKLLDRGAVPSFEVGSHRRIYVRDVIEFRDRRDADRRELAENLSHQRQNTSAAIDELAALI